MATHSSILTWRLSTDRRAWWAIVHGVTKSLSERLSTQHIISLVRFKVRKKLYVCFTSTILTNNFLLISETSL